MHEKLNDTEAMNQIFLVLDGEEWDSDTPCTIAEIVRQTGREPSEMGNLSRDELIDLLREDYLDSFTKDGHALPKFLDTGFTGFDNMSYSELLKEARDSNLTEE